MKMKKNGSPRCVSTGQILALLNLTAVSRLFLRLLLFDHGAVVSARAAGMQADLCAVRQNRHDFLHRTIQHNLLRWRWIPCMSAGAGMVSTDELTSIMSSLGYNASDEDIAAQLHQVCTTPLSSACEVPLRRCWSSIHSAVSVLMPVGHR